MVATFFVITGRMTEPGFLDATQIRELDRAGMDVGDHTAHHVDLRLLTPIAAPGRDGRLAQVARARCSATPCTSSPIRSATSTTPSSQRGATPPASRWRTRPPAATTESDVVAADDAADPRRSQRDPERPGVDAGRSVVSAAGRARDRLLATASVDSGPGGSSRAGDARRDRGHVRRARARRRHDAARPGQAELSPPARRVPRGLARRRRRSAAAGVKRLDERTCEIKKMYVVPAAPRHGRRPAAAARARGRRPGSSATPSLASTPVPGRCNAQGLYESEGYVEIEDFNGNPVAVFWGEKPLTE